MTIPAIKLDHLSYQVKGQMILEGIHLTIEEGEFIGIIGPNGSGKTTLFRLILGFITPHQGTIRIFNKQVKSMRQVVGYVPQFANFRRNFPITVTDAVLSGRLSRYDWLGGYRSSDRETADQMMEAMHITHLAKRPLAFISGGEMQRVLLARALVSQPRILLLDEPTTNVDNYREEIVFELLGRLKSTTTILLISHDLGFITPRVSRVACLHQTLTIHTPESIKADTIEQLYGHPVHAVHHQHAS